MLNSILVEQFASISRQKKSGVLTVVSPRLRLRFCIENGDPVALDYCTDKDLVLAQALLDFHKIGPEVHQMVVEAHQLGKGSVSEMVRRQQVVNDDEIAQVTRSMVEDTLVRCFGVPHDELVFDERDDAGTFDFDNSAIRLRIGTDVLLNTVQARVAEVDRVMAEVGGGNAIYTMSESESDAGPLNEFEKHVLNFIDGRKTIEEIAVAFRESTLNMSKMLCSMAERGVVKKAIQAQGGISRLRAAAQTAEPFQTPSVSSSQEYLSDFVPHRAAPEQGSNVALRVILVAALILVSGVGYLVIDSKHRSEALDTSTQAFVDQLLARSWIEALAHIQEARDQAGNDIVAIEKVNDLTLKFDNAIALEVKNIEKFIESEDYKTAIIRLSQLPIDRQPVELRRKITMEEQKLNRESDALVAQVAKLLDQGKAAQASQVTTNNSGRVGEAAAEYLQRWRLSSLERAGSATLPLSERSALVNQIIATNPPPHQRDQIERIKKEFERLQQKNIQLVKELGKLADVGDYKAVDEELNRLQLGTQLKGTPLAAEANMLREKNEATKKELEGLQSVGLELLATSSDVAEMGGYSEKVKQANEKWPQASNAAELKNIAQLLNEMSAFVADRNVLDQANAIDVWLQEFQPSPEIKTLVDSRVASLRKMEESANQALETARSFARQSDWEANERILKDIIARKEWSRTSAYVLAKSDLSSIDSVRGQQQAWQEELQAAMLAGDKDRSHEIAQRMGLRYLPLVIHSKPTDANVVRDGKVIGKTPFILNIPAGERTNLEFAIQKDGFDEKTVAATDAEGGWFLPVDLVRTSVGNVELQMTVTTKPTAINGTLYIASRQRGASITPGKEPVFYAFENPGTGELVGQPLYAAASASDDGIYYPTREGIVIRIGKQGIERLPIPARTDLAMTTYMSELIVDRRYFVIAGLDGAVHAGDEKNPLSVWHGPKGEKFVCGPHVINERIVIARANGVFEAYLPDDGKLVEQYQCDGPILSSWLSGGHLHAVTFNGYWRFDGLQEPKRTSLPQEAKSGGENMYITPDNRAIILQGDAWIDLGKFEGRVAGIPITWAGHAVVPCGKTMQVVGPHGFTLTNNADYLSPTIIGNQVAIVTMSGTVGFYAPK